MIDFPQVVSLTITNACNLRCQMCGQWSEAGYVRAQPERLKREMQLADWKRVVDELAEHHVTSLLLRGGEPFMFPGIIALLDYIHDRGLFVSIDTNGTRIRQYAEDIARIGKIHLTISLDGTPEVHDQVRGVPGTFERIREGVAALRQAEEKVGQPVSKSFNFTISSYSVSGLGGLPETICGTGVKSVAIVPYYYYPEAVGRAYEQEMQSAFGCPAYSWVGFHHETSGVDFDLFQAEHRRYLDGLQDISDFPYMPFSDEDYRGWFADALTPVGPVPVACHNVERLVDIQPDGEANFCIDFPDYSIGNVKDASIADLWNGERAERFRAYRRAHPLPICHRCGAKYMTEMTMAS